MLWTIFQQEQRLIPLSEKKQECFKAAKYLKRLLELDIKPRLVTLAYYFAKLYIFYRDILTRNSFLNAIVIITVLGGSTNGVRTFFRLVTTMLTFFAGPSSIGYGSSCRCRT